MSKHAIVCSNNPAVVSALLRALDRQRGRLTVCECGLEVLGTVEVVHADLLILDMETPGLNGLLLVSAIQQLVPGLPIVAVSTRSELDARALSQKGVAYATLPSGPEGAAYPLLSELAQTGTTVAARSAGQP